MDLGEGWARAFETAVCYDPNSVAAYLKQHGDAEEAHIVTTEMREGVEVVTETHWAEKTILGWLVGKDAPAEPPEPG